MLRPMQGTTAMEAALVCLVPSSFAPPFIGMTQLLLSAVLVIEKNALFYLQFDSVFPRVMNPWVLVLRALSPSSLRSFSYIQVIV